jgi:hypothetical protein
MSPTGIILCRVKNPDGWDAFPSSYGPGNEFRDVSALIESRPSLIPENFGVTRQTLLNTTYIIVLVVIITFTD